jgi:hypothetical protein
MATLIDNAKERLQAAGDKISHEAKKASDRVGDKKDEVSADAKVKQAEKERDSTKERNEFKEDLRD